MLIADLQKYFYYLVSVEKVLRKRNFRILVQSGKINFDVYPKDKRKSFFD